MPASRTARPLVAVIGALAAGALVAGAAAPAHADTVGLTLQLSAPVVTLPIGDGYQDGQSVAITASAATTASVALQADGGSPTVVDSDLELAAGTTPFTVPTAGLAAGTWSVLVTAADGATATKSFTVAALHAAVTKLTVARSVATVYPVKDGYRDAVVFTVTPTVSGPASSKVTGTAKLTRAGRTVKAWPVHSGRNRLSWNGRIGSKVKAGTYRLTVSAKGPQGPAKTATTTEAVSAKHLVTRTRTVVRAAATALQRFEAYDAADRGNCLQDGVRVVCRGYTAADGSTMSVVVGGSVGVPAAVRAGTAYARPQVRVAIRTRTLHGSAVWAAEVGTAQTATGSLRTGTVTGHWLKWSGNPAKASVALGLRNSTTLVVDRITFTYRYRALV